MTDKPNKIEIYAYNVYFGDCFLMLLKYPDQTHKSVLIDFGSMGKGKTKKGEAKIEEGDEQSLESTGKRLLRVAEHIREKCGGKLDVVVATHRHKDHIYGFGLKEAGKIIMECQPGLVIQPWTEDPADNRDLTKTKSLVDEQAFRTEASRNFAAMLADLHTVAGAIEAEAGYLGSGGRFLKMIDPQLQERIVFTADDNQIKNRAAVENLQKMGENHYVNYGYDKIDWEAVLPGVKVHILGPPSLEQSDEITSAARTSSEFWLLMTLAKNFWGVQAATSRLVTSHIEGERLLFSQDKVLDAKFVPANVRWFIRQLRSLRANQLLEIVRFVDNALNNTSVIMLFEIGEQKLLFPGDAQIENWQYALKKAKQNPALRRLLEETTVYKVGHHGSRNANPRSLWKNFKNKSDDRKKAGRLKTVVSTMEGKHGESEETAVPLPKMVREMKATSDYHSTEEIENGFFEIIEIAVN